MYMHVLCNEAVSVGVDCDMRKPQEICISVVRVSRVSRGWAMYKHRESLSCRLRFSLVCGRAIDKRPTRHLVTVLPDGPYSEYSC